MKALKTIEDKMAGVFKDLPQLPDNSKEGLAKVWPWIALVTGLLQLIAARTLWDLSRLAERVTDLAKSLSIYYAGVQTGPSGLDKTVIYLGILMLVVDAVLLLMAFPKLRKRQRQGWDLLFLAAILNLIYGVVQIFTYDRGIGAFIGSLIGSAIAFYLLFSVREKFGGGRKAATPATASKE